MMKKTLSLLMLASLGSGTAMAVTESTEWLVQQTENLKSESGMTCLDGLEKTVAGLSWLSPSFRSAVQSNLHAYESNVRLAIDNLAKTGKSNAAIYNQITHSLKFWNDKFYGRPIVKCVSPYLNFQDLYREETVAMNRYRKTKDQADFEVVMKARQAQLNLANRALVKIKSLQNAAK